MLVQCKLCGRRLWHFNAYGKHDRAHRSSVPPIEYLLRNVSASLGIGVDRYGLRLRKLATQESAGFPDALCHSGRGAAPAGVRRQQQPHYWRGWNPSWNLHHYSHGNGCQQLVTCDVPNPNRQLAEPRIIATVSTGETVAVLIRRQAGE